MKRKELTELLEQHEADVLRFSYGDDKFARMLLAFARQRYGSVRALKETPFGRLLSRPSIRSDCLRNAPRTQAARVFEGGPFRPLTPTPREDPSWFLLEL